MATGSGISKDAQKLLSKLERGFDKALGHIRKAQQGKKFGAREAEALLAKLYVSEVDDLDAYAFELDTPEDKK